MTDQQTQNIMDRAVCFSLSLHGVGNNKQVAQDKIKTDVQQDWLHVGKKLLDAKSFGAIKNLDGEIKRWLKTRCLPSLFRAGIYLLPVELIDEVDAKIETYKSRRRNLTDVFCDEYPTLVEEARGPLGSQYDEADYPPVERVRAAFYVVTQYLSFSTPGKLSRAMFEREKSKAEKQWSQAADAITGALTNSMGELVGYMAKALEPDVNGKTKKIYTGPIEKMREFLDLFQCRNLGNSEELTQLVGRAKALLNGTDAEILRSDADLRARVQNGFEEIKNNLASMIQDRPTRMISFEE